MNKVILSFITFMALFCSIAEAQNVKKSLNECIEMALNKNPAIKADVLSVERSKVLERTAFDIGNTDITLNQDPTSGGGPDNSLSIGQKFGLPVVYRSQKKLLKAKTGLESRALDLSKNELLKDVHTAYFRLLYLFEYKKILLKQDTLYKTFLHIATAKVEAGESNVLERINAEKLYNENKLVLDNAAKDISSTQIYLQSLIYSDELVEPLEPQLFLLASPLSRLDVQNTPTNKIWQAQNEINEQNLKVTKNGYLPSFSLAFNYQMLIKGFNPYNIDRQRFKKGDFTGLSIGVSLPLVLGAQKAKTKAAWHDLEITKLKQEADNTNRARTYDSYLNDLLKSKNSLKYYDETGMRQADKIINISQLAYEKGGINYIEYIQNLKTALEISLQHIAVMNDYNQSVIQLNYLQGYENK